MSHSIPGIQGARSHMFGFSGAITPENPNIYSIKAAFGGCKADSRAFNHTPCARRAAKSSYSQASPPPGKLEAERLVRGDSVVVGVRRGKVDRPGDDPGEPVDRLDRRL